MRFTWKGTDKIQSKKSMIAGLRAMMLIIVLLLSISFLVSVFYIVNKEKRETIKRESDTALNTIADSIVSDIERYKEMSRIVMTDDGLVKYLYAYRGKIDAGFKFATQKSIMRYPPSPLKRCKTFAILSIRSENTPLHILPPKRLQKLSTLRVTAK